MTDYVAGTMINQTTLLTSSSLYSGNINAGNIAAGNVSGNLCQRCQQLGSDHCQRC